MAVRATSALAGLYSVKRVAAQPKERTRRREGQKKSREDFRKERRASAATTFPEETGNLRDQSSPERTKTGVSKGNPLNR